MIGKYVDLLPLRLPATMAEPIFHSELSDAECQIVAVATIESRLSTKKWTWKLHCVRSSNSVSDSMIDWLQADRLPALVKTDETRAKIE